MGDSFSSNLSDKAKILIRKHPKLKNKINSIMKNKNLLESMKDKIMNIKGVEMIFTKGEETFNRFNEDKNAQVVKNANKNSS